ncbi:MAG: right-handed parallel beta-helix repeat-containing protein [Lentisphaeria bacterium]|nr:right-handed parallel beta-helix repeat-containing protein [Lentisphaeria bacterium]
MKKTALLLMLAATFLCCGKEYFVSNSGDDKSDGSRTRPFKTISRAVKAVKAGDIVTVRGGTYRELVLIRGVSGTPDKPIVFRGAPGETALLTGALPVKNKWKKTAGFRFIYESVSDLEICMLFDSKELNRYMRVDSLEMLDRQPGSFMLDKRNGKLYVNTLRGEHPEGLCFQFIPYFAGSSRYGAGFVDLVPFSGNITGVYGFSKGVMIYGSNIIWENFHVAFFPGQNIRVNAPADNVIIRNNTVYGGTCGIMFYGKVKNSKMINNKVFRVAGTGLQLAGDGDKCLIKGNTVDTCGTTSPFKGAKTGSEGNVYNIAHYGSFSSSDIIDNTVIATDRERCGSHLMRNKGGIRKFTTQTGNVFYGGGVSLYATDDGSALLANNTCAGGNIQIGYLTSGKKYTPVIKDNLYLKDRTKGKFADVYHHDFRLRPDSPYLGKGAFPKAGNVIYVSPKGSGDGSIPEKAASFGSALSKVQGKEATVYLLPGTYTGKAVFAGNVKLANYQGGKVIVNGAVFISKGQTVVDGIIFKRSSFRVSGDIRVRRSVFDGCDVQGKRVILENTTLQDSRISGKVTLRNSLVCGSGNAFAAAGMVSENNCFTSQSALGAFQKKVSEAHKSFFRNVKLGADFSLPAGSDLACAGLDCSAIGGRPTAVAALPVLVENLFAKAVSSDSVMVSWSTPRHYCNVSVRSYSLSERRHNSSAGVNQGSLRESSGQVLLQKFLPGKEYKITFYFYPISGQKMVSRTLNFKMPEKFDHKPVTLHVDKKAPGAFRSICEAMAKAGPGDTILVGPGVYTESVPVYLSGITLKSRIPGKAILNLAGLLNYCIMSVNTRNVTVEGFQFTGLPYSAGGKTISTSNVVNFTLRNCYFQRPAHGGTGNIHLFGYDPKGMLIENCVFDSGFHGIWIYPGKDVTIRNCTFSGGGVNAIHVGCLKGSKTTIYNNIFVDTVSNHNSPAVSVAVHGPHVYCDYNLYWKTKRAPMQRYYAFGRHKTHPIYSAVWHVLKKDMPLTLAETQKRFGVEKHAVEADPLFVDAPGKDFTLHQDSPARGKGRNGENLGADFSIFK